MSSGDRFPSAAPSWPCSFLNDRTGTLIGQLQLRATWNGRESALSVMHRTAPFHVGQHSDRVGGGRVEAIVQGVGPGHLPTDQLDIQFRSEPDSTLVVRGQGANRIYSSPKRIAASAEIRLDAAARSTLIYLPGEIIPYRSSILEQRTTVHADALSRVAVAEVVTAGRTGMGETYLFDRLDLRTRVLIDETLRLQGRMLFRQRWIRSMSLDGNRNTWTPQPCT